MTLKAPWLKHYNNVAHHLDYPEGSMLDVITATAQQYPNYKAYSFMGCHTTYKEMIDEIHRVARAFAAVGIKEDDRVTLCLPNLPQTVLCFYALNLIGAIPNMIHPLSSEGEIVFYLQDSESVAVLTLDQFYPKFENVRKKIALPHLIITSMKDALSPVMKVGYSLTEGRKVPKLPANADVTMWKDLLAMGDAWQGKYEGSLKPTDPAVILYSGGTSGKTKGIFLSSLNFNALAIQTITMDTNFKPQDKILSVMPMFHGFGLGISIHTFLVFGGCCLLIPRFNPDTYAQLLAKQKPNYIAGVPTLYEALLRLPSMEDIDLSCLKGVFSGGDSLSIELKKRFDAFLADHNASVQVREGYGTTECVTASCLTPYNKAKEGSIGIPFPDTYYKICKPNTCDEQPFGEEGEICLTGPTLMLGYANNSEETADTLRQHADGLTWLHTGDLGVMDDEGFIYFRQRMKRMIISSGYSIYPSQLENVFDAHEKVHMSCCIGVADPLKVQKVKAFVMLKPGFEASAEVKDELMTYCRENIARYAMPYDIEFRADLPRTLVGKVAYKILEEEEAQKALARTEAEAMGSVLQHEEGVVEPAI